MSIQILAQTGGRCSHDPDVHVESFVESLRAAGYAQSSIKKRRWAVRAFVKWMGANDLAVLDAEEAHVVAFLERAPQHPKDRHRVERAALGLFFSHLRGLGVLSPPASSPALTPAEALTGRFADYLRAERGLCERSIRVYLPYVGDFLAAREKKGNSASFAALDAEQVREFLLERIRGRPTEYAHLVSTVLRSFLRFVFLHGETPLDLSISVPFVRRFTLAHVPEFLTYEEVQRILSATDRTTATGQRDHAVLLLLARLGLRAGEVVTLELDDIRWRTGEIVVHGKGRILDRMPLLPDVGEALALYVQKARPRTESRRVFVRVIAPHVGLMGPASVGHIVRAALRRVGSRPARRGAAHLFRHSLATTMIRQGASMPEISEVLRHRSPATTAIYAKVAFETLREVARPWPGTGGGQ